MVHDELPAPPGIRLGDAERERAAETLGEHLRAGRLDTCEYDDRVATVFAARTAEQINPMFTDLPGGSPLASVPPDRASYGTEANWGSRGRRWPARWIAVLVVAVLVVAAITHHPPFFLIPLALVFLLVGPRGGSGQRGSGQRGSGRRRFGQGPPMTDRWATGGPGRSR